MSYGATLPLKGEWEDCLRWSPGNQALCSAWCPDIGAMSHEITPAPLESTSRYRESAADDHFCHFYNLRISLRCRPRSPHSEHQILRIYDFHSISQHRVHRFSVLNETLPGHVIWLLKSHHIQDSRSNISKRTRMIPPTNLKLILARPGLCHDKRNMRSLPVNERKAKDIQYEPYEDSSHLPKSSFLHFYN
jgi:hypothetical protein